MRLVERKAKGGKRRESQREFCPDKKRSIDIQASCFRCGGGHGRGSRGEFASHTLYRSQYTAIPERDSPVIYARDWVLTLALLCWPIPVKRVPSRCRPVPAEADRRSRCLTGESEREPAEEQERKRDRGSVLCTISPVFVYPLSLVCFFCLSAQHLLPCLLLSSHPIPPILLIAVHKRHPPPSRPGTSQK